MENYSETMISLSGGSQERQAETTNTQTHTHTSRASSWLRGFLWIILLCSSLGAMWTEQAEKVTSTLRVRWQPQFNTARHPLWFPRWSASQRIGKTIPKCSNSIKAFVHIYIFGCVKCWKPILFVHTSGECTVQREASGANLSCDISDRDAHMSILS